MSPESRKATLIAKALHQMANASANLQIVAAMANGDVARFDGWRFDYTEDASRWQVQYDKAAADLDALLEPTPL